MNKTLISSHNLAKDVNGFVILNKDYFLIWDMSI